ncbi:hypothetical protein SISNIDRAFT_453268, partial [Sistotremastrum niveocremeum HHB9708]
MSVGLRLSILCAPRIVTTLPTWVDGCAAPDHDSKPVAVPTLASESGKNKELTLGSAVVVEGGREWRVGVQIQ